MAIGRVLISVNQLKLGMFVVELDRPWLGTPFLFQGFHIRSPDDIERLKEQCDAVYVDIEKSIRHHASPILNSVEEQSHRKSRVYEMSAPFEEEIKTANEIRATTQACLDELFDDVENGRNINMTAVKQVINATIDGILRNPDAHVCLTQLKNWDQYTAQHSINVSILSLAFARHLGLPRSQMEMLGVGALLHDIGKLKTPLDVLNKPDKLTDDEYTLMKAHPTHGREIIENKYGLSSQIADIAFSHHERIAGSGYPRGLGGDKISYWGKLVAIVDVYDAITSERCYHKGMAPTEALTKMYGWRMTDFDAELLEQFIQTVGIYPVGTLVELNTGEVGIVISVNPVARLRPKVDLLLDAEKRPYFPSRVINLADQGSSGYGDPLSIRTVLPAGKYGISIREHLKTYQQVQAKKFVNS